MRSAGAGPGDPSGVRPASFPDSPGGRHASTDPLRFENARAVPRGRRGRADPEPRARGGRALPASARVPVHRPVRRFSRVSLKRPVHRAWGPYARARRVARARAASSDGHFLREAGHRRELGWGQARGRVGDSVSSALCASLRARRRDDRAFGARPDVHRGNPRATRTEPILQTGTSNDDTKESGRPEPALPGRVQPESLPGASRPRARPPSPGTAPRAA